MLVWRTDSNNDISFGHGLADYATDAEACAQSVKARLELLQGEWFLDIDAGVPYLQRIMVKPSDVQYARAVIVQTVLGTFGVLSVDSLSMDFDHDTRKFNISIDATTIYADQSSIKVTV